MKLSQVITERNIDHNSGIFAVIDDNLKLTDKKGGPVRVSIVRGQQLSVAVGEFKDDNYHQIKASFSTGGKWAVKEFRGEMVGKVVRKKAISDEEMTKAVQAVFDAAKRYYR